MSDPVLITKLKDSLLKGERAVLCTVIEKKGHGPREVGSKMLVTEQGEHFGSIGGGSMERFLIEQAFDVLKNGKCRTLHFAMGIPPREGMIAIDSQCGGEVKIFMDIIKPEPRLFVMGSGLIAQLTAKFAKNCGFEIFIVDDAPTAIHNNFPNMIIINDRYPESLKQVKIKNSDYVIILHGDTFFELSALRHALNSKPSFIGLLGSKNKIERHKETLKSEGYSENQLEILQGPIGIDINAETPEEISISIVAELIKIKRS